MNDKALDILKQVKAYNDGTPKQSNAVFLNKDGMRISYQQVQKATKKFCKAAGIPYRGEHVFRHTFATNKYNKKVDIKVLSQILGHSSTTVTYDIYINLFGGGLDAMREAMNA